MQARSRGGKENRGRRGERRGGDFLPEEREWTTGEVWFDSPWFSWLASHCTVFSLSWEGIFRFGKKNPGGLEGSGGVVEAGL